MVPTPFIILVVALVVIYKYVKLWNANKTLTSENQRLKEQLLDYKLNTRSNDVLGF